MKEIFCVFKTSRVRREELVTGKLQYLPAFPEEIEVDGTGYGTAAAFWPANRFDWRRFEILGTPASLLELGKIGSSSQYLFLALMTEPLANALRRLVDDLTLWTLRQFLAEFEDHPAGVRSTWPADWFRPNEGGEPDPTRPFVGMAPASTTGLATAGADADEASEWNTSSTLEQAERFVARFGVPA